MIAKQGGPILAPINPHTGVSMSRPAKLTGYEILVRMHIVLGHASVPAVLSTLARMPKTANMITRQDVEEFQRRGCGICDTALMTTPNFPKSDGLQPLPEPGQYWIRDTVQLRKKAFHLNAWYLTVYTCKRSVYWLLLPHADYTADTVINLDQQLRVFNHSNTVALLVFQFLLAVLLRSPRLAVEAAHLKEGVDVGVGVGEGDG